MQHLSQQGQLPASHSTDLTQWFPELELSDWDRVGEIKKYLTHYTPAKIEEVQKFRVDIARFHHKHPEFLQQLAEARKK